MPANDRPCDGKIDFKIRPSILTKSTLPKYYEITANVGCFQKVGHQEPERR